MATSSSTVDDVFSRLIATYGRRFLDQWPGLQLAAVKAIWERELRAYERRPGAVLWALDHLPEHPVNAIEFRNLCRAAPSGVTPRLPMPDPDPVAVAAALEEVALVRRRLARLSQLARCDALGERDRIAKDMKERLAAGHRPTIGAREMMREIVSSLPPDELTPGSAC